MPRHIRRRWQRQPIEVLAIDAIESSSGSASSHMGCSLEDGMAYFPVMSESEVAAISVPAFAPADQLRSTLAEHGVCLVTDVLDLQECLHLEDLWNTDLANVLGIAKNDTNKTAIKCFRKQGASAWPQEWSNVLGKKGVASQRGLPHGAFAWSSRMHPRVRKTFADIFQTSVDNMVVGLDCVFWSGTDASATESNKEWLHCDQNHRTGLTWPCVQGVLYVWPSEGKGTSTTVVWPGSHQDVYDRIMEDSAAIKRGKSMGGQSIKLSQLNNAGLRKALTDEAMVACRRVPCPAGSLLLWDSRTIHQGWAGGPRLAQPVCWEPRQRRESDPAALARKVFMCAAGLPSSHSSAEARVHGMAPRSRPCEVIEGDEMPAVKAQIRPHCVAKEKHGEWEKAQKTLWLRGAIDHADPQALVDLLKPDILSVL